MQVSDGVGLAHCFYIDLLLDNDRESGFASLAARVASSRVTRLAFLDAARRTTPAVGDQNRVNLR
jgi:hypothetical protein